MARSPVASKKQKSPRTSSTPNGEKGKKNISRSPFAIVKGKKNKDVKAKSYLQKNNIQFWQERGYKS